MSEIPPRPKTSIFEQTLPGVAAEELPRKGFLARFHRAEPVPTPEPTPEPPSSGARRPKTSIFEQTLPGVSLDGLSSSAALPASLQAPSVSPDPEDWDEGTCTEWHPRYAGQVGTLAPSASVSPVHDFRPWVRFAAWIGGFVVVVLAFGAWAMHPPQAPVPAPKNVPEALKGYVQQAESGDVGAMRVLGLRYAYGIGVAPDLAEGKAWLRRAAQAGSLTAQRELEALGGKPELTPR